ncbi:uncharacterized protein LOC117940580 [Etheostoma cragini]|uniref:uncharacterized protein LOC117940580 n=1 Tax=Etheostoma cragini TaxID=417921 RepID=UPI00155F00A7|nr:uncharacterized protein LOC117940580 [Etheostoma cragini]
MKTSGPFLLLLLLCSTGSGQGSVVVRNYWYQSFPFTWQDAQSSCRSSPFYGDLATIFSQSDEDGLNLNRYYAWTGMRKPKNYLHWIWVSDGDYSNLVNSGISDLAEWNQLGNTYCAVAEYPDRLHGTDCDGANFFFCHKRHYGPNGDVQYTYKFVPQAKSWPEARQICSTDSQHDLATFQSFSDLRDALDPQDYPVWIGLYRDGGTWKWSSRVSEYRNWEGKPGSDDCVSISSETKRMSTQDCAARFPSLCYTDNLVLVKENKTWEGALEHCRALNSNSRPYLRYELVSVQPGGDHDYLMNRVMEAETEEVWAGLRFLAGEWLWVNGASMLYSDLPLCPPVVQHCGALSKNSTGSMETRDCSEKRNFMCYSTY